VPLHTNGSERDLRPQVIKRKISGGTRSEQGRACRDAFLGLLLTCASSAFRSGTISATALASLVPPRPTCPTSSGCAPPPPERPGFCPSYAVGCQAFYRVRTQTFRDRWSVQLFSVSHPACLLTRRSCLRRRARGQGRSRAAVPAGTLDVASAAADAGAGRRQSLPRRPCQARLAWFSNDITVTRGKHARQHPVTGLVLPAAVGAKAAALCRQGEVGEPICKAWSARQEGHKR
jgi:hypothetical protein